MKKKERINELQSLERLLEIHRKNLIQLRIDEAGHDRTEVPTRIKREIELEKKEIEKIRKEMNKLMDKKVLSKAKMLNKNRLMIIMAILFVLLLILLPFDFWMNLISAATLVGFIGFVLMFLLE